MEARRVAGDLADPAGAVWSDIESEVVALAPVPLDAQPTEYIRVTWTDRPYGTVAEADVAAAHDGARLFVRLSFADSEIANAEFNDAAAIYFPSNASAPAHTFGAPDAPVELCLWQANLARGVDLVGYGPGVFTPTGTGAGATAGALGDGRWTVVLSRTLDGLASRAQLGVAVWDGSNEERAGIGAATPEWISLDVVS